jgi:hypothetical protein
MDLLETNMVAGFSPSFFGLSLLMIISPLLHSRLSPISEVCNTRDQEAHYHIIGL